MGKGVWGDRNDDSWRSDEFYPGYAAVYLHNNEYGAKYGDSYLLWAI